MQLRYNFRIEPSPGQRAALARVFGCARVVWNDAVAQRRAAYEAGESFPNTGDLSKRLITHAKRTPKREWLSEVSAVALQQTLRDQDRAWRAFFESRKKLAQWKAAGRKGPKPHEVNEPRFKSRKDHRQAARFTAKRHDSPPTP